MVSSDIKCDTNSLSYTINDLDDEEDVFSHLPVGNGMLRK